MIDAQTTLALQGGYAAAPAPVQFPGLVYVRAARAHVRRLTDGTGRVRKVVKVSGGSDHLRLKGGRQGEEASAPETLSLFRIGGLVDVYA